MKIGIIGLGLIGGSMALSLRKTNLVKKIIGTDQNPQNALHALELGIVEEIVAPDVLIAQSEIIILATPVNEIRKILPELLNKIPDKSIVLDTGSTKEEICQSVAEHSRRDRFVATHPIAGTEYSGPEAAFDGLFEGKTTIICQAERSGPHALEKVEIIYQKLRMPSIRMDAEAHDLHMAYISHLSHILSFGLVRTVLNVEKDEKNILHLAGSGFSSTARLAKSRPETWLPIFRSNKSKLLKAIETYIDQLNDFRTFLKKTTLKPSIGT